jgi:predicted alpha/beta hydrolase family esterase
VDSQFDASKSTYMSMIKVLIVHGGMTFRSQRDYLRYLRTKKISTHKKVYWSGSYLEKSLGKGFEIITPRMPLQDNAKYRDWKIIFERYLPLLGGRFILIGTSLGGVFLAKYLSENKLRQTAISAFMVCPPFDNSLPGEDLVGGFKLKRDLSLLMKNARRVHLLFSRDDKVVPVYHAKQYQRKLPQAHFAIYPSKNGHFQVTKFPEIVKMIKSDSKQPKH